MNVALSDLPQTFRCWCGDVRLAGRQLCAKHQRVNRVIAAIAFCCGLSIGYPAHATIVYLARNITVAQTGSVPDKAQQFQNLALPAGSALAVNQVFQVITTTSCTAQIVGSVDGVNWVNYGTAITQSSGGSAAAVGTAPYAWLGAIVTAVTGTCSVLMSE